MTTYYEWIESPLCPLLLTADGRSLTGLYLKDQKYFPTEMQHWTEASSIAPLPQVREQISEYFAGQRQTFDIPLNPAGTDFQQKVWQSLRQIPFGTTISYGTLAKMIGTPSASRAVGAANGRNPIAIIVPCHRVVAANRQLTGYAGGLDRKRWLLHHEQSHIADPNELQLKLIDI